MSEPLYQSIYKDIKQSILDSTYPVGTQLPTDKELTEKYDVSTITIKKAMDLLKEDQLISRKPRKGTFVETNSLTKQENATPIDRTLPLIGLIVTDFSDVFGTNILRDIVSYSHEKAHVLFKISAGDPKREEQMINELVELGVDGIVLIPASSDYISSRLLELVSQNFPIVLVDRMMENLPTCNVQIDNQQAAVELTEYLFNNGHERIGIVTASTHITTIEERIDGVLQAHVSNHVPINQSQIFRGLESMVPNSSVHEQEDVQKIKEFLLREPDLTAIFTGEYAIALLVKQAIEELGHEVYRDYSVVCFDHPQNRRLDKHAFVFTHILQDQQAMAQRSLDLILEKIKNPNLIEKIRAPYHLVPGMSVKPLVDKKAQ